MPQDPVDFTTIVLRPDPLDTNANLDEIAQQYAGAEAAIEATSNYYHIHDTLSEYLDVTVAHPTKLTLIADTDKKTDRIDAKELARMVRLDAVPESYVPPEQIREARALRARATEVLRTRWSRTEPISRSPFRTRDH